MYHLYRMKVPIKTLADTSVRSTSSWCKKRAAPKNALALANQHGHHFVITMRIAAWAGLFTLERPMRNDGIWFAQFTISRLGRFGITLTTDVVWGPTPLTRYTYDSPQHVCRLTSPRANGSSSNPTAPNRQHHKWLRAAGATARSPMPERSQCKISDPKEFCVAPFHGTKGQGQSWRQLRAPSCAASDTTPMSQPARMQRRTPSRSRVPPCRRWPLSGTSRSPA